MATAVRSAASRQDKVFNSVFSDISTRPRKRLRQYEPQQEAQTHQIRRSLYHAFRDLFGIGGEGFVFGFEIVDQNGSPFRAPVDLCAPMSEVRMPTDSDIELQRTKMEQSQIWLDFIRWKQVLGSDQLKKLIAGLIHQLIQEYVHWAYGFRYRDDVEAHLNFWAKHVLGQYIMLTLRVINLGTPPTAAVDICCVSPTHIPKWQEMAQTRLGALRVDELFDMIVEWDEEVNGVDDLKRFISSPATRSYVTNNFINSLTTRLLHPGASTIEILQLYISIIRAFRKLDPKGVLLDRVARKVRRYLRERDDTVKVIVSGLLSDAFDENGNPLPPNPDVLTELAAELIQRDAANDKNDDGEFDWNNMDWMPDPADAAPDYMKSKNTDVIGSLTSLFESKDVFVKELQMTLADRLLKNKPNFDQEIGVLEHLKIRFGDSALQGCEVMLRDVLDSRKVDTVIRRDQGMQTDAGRTSKPNGQAELHAKILSRLFWPSISDQTFKVPPPIDDLQQSYEKGFESLKQSRKLTWLNAIGHVEVELELDDRVFHDEVLPWQASVIYAFQNSSSDSKSVTKTIQDLSTSLEMTPALVRSACIYWVSKRILHETSRDTFTVLDRLPDNIDNNNATTTSDPTQTQTVNDASIAAAELAAAQALKEAEEAERKQKMAMYHQFIINMLTNQGATPLPRIAMMLGIVVPGGFPFSNEELKEFLGQMVKEGVLEIGGGGNYKVAS